MYDLTGFGCASITPRKPFSNAWQLGAVHRSRGNQGPEGACPAQPSPQAAAVPGCSPSRRGRRTAPPPYCADTMKHVAAYLLAQLGGNSSPDAKARLHSVLHRAHRNHRNALCSCLVACLWSLYKHPSPAATRALRRWLYTAKGKRGGGVTPGLSASRTA